MRNVYDTDETNPTRGPVSALTAAVLMTSPRALSFSTQACLRAVDHLNRLNVTSRLFDLRRFPTAPAGLEDYPVEIVMLQGVVKAADVVVIGAPVHRNMVSGWTRNWVELMRASITAKPVLPIVAAGSARGHLAAIAWQADLFTAFDARPVRPVVVHDLLPEDELAERLESAVADLVGAAEVAS
jgi:NAD(P)H-dependent FMN reductase